MVKPRSRNKYFLVDDDVTAVDVDELAEKMIAWSMEEGNIVLGEFIARAGFPMPTFKKWLQRSEKLRNAYSIARTMVGTRREKGGLQGEYSPLMVMKTMPLYDQDYKELLEWESQQKNVEQASMPQQQIIVLDRFPESDKVPPIALTSNTRESSDGSRNKDISEQV